MLLNKTKKMLLYRRTALTKSLKVVPTSGISRNKTLIKATLLLNKKLKSLSTKLLWRSGIGKSGKITVFSKGKKLYKLSAPLVNHKFLDNSLHFLYGISYYRSKSSPYALFFSSSGKYCYKLSNNFNSHFFIFKSKGLFDKFANKNALLSYNLNFPNFYILQYSLFRVTFMSFIKNLQISSGNSIQFSRSLGSYSIILRKNLELLSAVVKLPSGVKKVFSLFASCYVDEKRSEHSTHYKTLDKRSSYVKKLAPRSRGVARNPVDHPHGGRTKSIKYPRTPWGKTTKFK